MRTLVAFACASILGLALFDSVAFANDEQARQACCTQMGGVYRTGNGFGYGNRMACYSLGRGGNDAFYKCVLGKSGGSRGSKNK